MSDKTTLIIEPNSQNELLTFIDVLARISSAGFVLEKISNISREEILEQIPELGAFLFRMKAEEWLVRKVTSPQRIIFNFYFEEQGTACFIVLSNGQFVYTMEKFNMFFPGV